MAAIWAGKVGISCTSDSARMLHNKYLCSRHFLESDFTIAEESGSSLWLRFCFTVTPRTSCPFITHPFLESLVLSYVTHKDYVHIVFPTTYNKILVPSP
jgi:hypothetical protein